jgi:hypothetical protein
MDDKEYVQIYIRECYILGLSWVQATKPIKDILDRLEKEKCFIKNTEHLYNENYTIYDCT